MNLPLFIDPQAWTEYEQMRRRIKKPLTELAAKRLLNRCVEMEAKGHDVNEALLIAADAHWLTIYPPKDMSIPSKESRSFAQSNAWLKEQEEAKKRATRPPERVLRMVGKV